MDNAELKRLAQAKLSEARKCLDEAAAFAEQGGFNISFRVGGTYVPSAAFDRKALEAKALTECEERVEGWTEMSDDEKAGYIEDFANEMKWELCPHEYADEAGWWMPSRNC